MGLIATLVALVPAISVGPTVDFLIQTMGLGLAAGMLIAFVADMRKPNVHVWRITTFCSLFGLGVGLVIVVVDAVAS